MNNVIFHRLRTMKVALCVWLIIAATRAEEEDGAEVYTKNNPLGLRQGKVFYSSYGQVFDLYSTDKEIRNILVPPSEYLSIFDFYHPDGTKHPPVFFNLYQNGKNDGIYMLKDQIAKKIKDGSDSTADYPTDSLDTHDVPIYISASDGIYTYNPKNDLITKFGTITDKFKAIDKVSNKDEIYVLGTDDKIYKITDQGTIKTKVEAIDYAKDFVLDRTGAIYFLGADNKPQVLYKGSTTSVKITGLNFDVKKSFLSRPLWDLYSETAPNHLIPYNIEGVSYVLLNSSAIAVPCDNTVSGLTAFSTEYSFVHFYGVKGHIYMHTILADNPTVTLKRGSSKNFRIVAFNKDVEADFHAFKALRRRHQKH